VVHASSGQVLLPHAAHRRRRTSCHRQRALPVDPPPGVPGFSTDLDRVRPYLAQRARRRPHPRTARRGPQPAHYGRGEPSPAWPSRLHVLQRRTKKLIPFVW